MRKLSFILCVLSFIIVSRQVEAQPPDTLWSANYGVEYFIESGVYAVETSDGGYIMMGNSTLLPDIYDSFLAKYDNSGQIIWSNQYFNYRMEIIAEGRQTSDEGYIICGHGRDLRMTFHVQLIKTDSDGDVLWNKTYSRGFDDYAHSIDVTDDGGFIIAASSYISGDNQHWLIKTNDRGDTLWTNIPLEDSETIPHGIRQTQDGGYIITGSMYNVSTDLFLLKTDDEGNEVWTQIFGGDEIDIGISVRQTFEGGYILTGYTQSMGFGNKDVYLIKTDSLGIEEWSFTFGGSEADEGICVQQTADSGFVVCGYTFSFYNGEKEFYLIKTDNDGNLEWENVFECDEYSLGNWIEQTDDLGFIATGLINISTPLYSQAWIIRFDNELSVGRNFGQRLIADFNLFPPFPNPFNKSTVISYQLPVSGAVSLLVYDIAGRELAKLINGYQSVGNHEIIFDAKDLVSGVYFVRLEAGEFCQVQKVVLMK